MCHPEYYIKICCKSCSNTYYIQTHTLKKNIMKENYDILSKIVNIFLGSFCCLFVLNRVCTVLYKLYNFWFHIVAIFGKSWILGGKKTSMKPNEQAIKRNAVIKWIFFYIFFSWTFLNSIFFCFNHMAKFTHWTTKYNTYISYVYFVCKLFMERCKIHFLAVSLQVFRNILN